MQDLMAKRKGKALHVWIDAKLRKAIADSCKQNRRKLNEEVAIALEKYLSDQKLWPPMDAKRNGKNEE